MSIQETVEQRLADPLHRRVGDRLWGLGADANRMLPEGTICDLCGSGIKITKKITSALWFEDDDAFVHTECAQEVYARAEKALG